MKPDETDEAAALREALEETGLEGLRLVRFLGEQMRDMSDYGNDETHHRFFFHLLSPDDPPLTWRHYETDAADGSASTAFDFFWAPIADPPALVAEHGRFLAELGASLSSVRQR